MKTIYRKSKIKISLLIITIALIFITSVFILSYNFINSRSSTFFIIFIFISLLIISLNKIKSQFKEYLVIQDKIMFISVPRSWQIEFNKIKRIGYVGTKFLPMSEMMTIESDIDTIYIDFNFSHYTKVWNEVLDICIENNTQIQVDNKLLKRLKTHV